MASQTDLDQGGTVRQLVRRYLGPSVGWVGATDVNVLPITTTGTTTAVVGTTLVTVNVAAVVTVQLPSAKAPAGIPAGALPGLNIGLPMTIVDIGGNAGSFNITILPFAGETIMGLASVTISSPYGSFVLIPNLTSGGWNQS